MTWHYFIGLSRIKTVDSAQETKEEHPLNSYALLTVILSEIVAEATQNLLIV